MERLIDLFEGIIITNVSMIQKFKEGLEKNSKDSEKLEKAFKLKTETESKI